MNNVQLNDDVLGLIVFKSDLHDPSSSLASWKDDSSACSWNRVQCNPATGRVTKINLAGLELSGRIGKGLEKLQHLMLFQVFQFTLFYLNGCQILTSIRDLFKLCL
ncbi:hypothetical protein HN51_054629 [Arachis hypogaea]